eukprot:COSAG01_NODE_17264_length_1165_cov_1.550657_2_plen_66_part_01
MSGEGVRIVNPLTPGFGNSSASGTFEPSSGGANKMLLLECDEHDGVIEIFNEDERASRSLPPLPAS